jgi:hypothetical protein
MLGATMLKLDWKKSSSNNAPVAPQWVARPYNSSSDMCSISPEQAVIAAALVELLSGTLTVRIPLGHLFPGVSGVRLAAVLAEKAKDEQAFCRVFKAYREKRKAASASGKECPPFDAKDNILWRKAADAECDLFRHHRDNTAPLQVCMQHACELYCVGFVTGMLGGVR